MPRSRDEKEKPKRASREWTKEKKQERENEKK
jgi:hypothetical protein